MAWHGLQYKNLTYLFQRLTVLSKILTDFFTLTVSTSRNISLERQEALRGPIEQIIVCTVILRLCQEKRLPLHSSLYCKAKPTQYTQEEVFSWMCTIVISTVNSIITMWNSITWCSHFNDDNATFFSTSRVDAQQSPPKVRLKSGNWVYET